MVLLMLLMLRLTRTTMNAKPRERVGDLQHTAQICAIAAGHNVRGEKQDKPAVVAETNAIVDPV
jgi:hypothetical protein